MLHDFQLSDAVLMLLLLIVVACFVAIQFAPKTTNELK
jgi:hypothetical protein